jgi:hypothetical protein
MYRRQVQYQEDNSMSGDKMNINILCDQKDCIFNQPFANAEELTYCKHPHPSIQKYGEFPQWSRCICNTKKIVSTFEKEKTLINAVRKDRCDECGLQNSESCNTCLNIPPKPIKS